MIKSSLDILEDYRHYLFTFGYEDAVVKAMRYKLLNYLDDNIDVGLDCVHQEFDLAVFNNQTEGIF